MNQKSEPLKTHQPCPCGRSSDAFTIYTDGHGFCFSGACEKPYFKKASDDVGSVMESSDTQYSYQYLEWRKILPETFQKYKTMFKCSDAGPEQVGFNYFDEFYKLRSYKDKKFFISGQRKDGLFGKNIFPKGSFKTILITEGELDAMSAYQMTGLPAVSVQSSSQALKDCQADYDYLNGADRIILLFDGDDPGRKAAKAVASLFDFNKVFFVEFLEHKDSNEYLEASKGKEFQKLVNNAKKFVPDGVISTYKEIEEVLAEGKIQSVVSFPFVEGEEKLEGLRLGTSILISGKEGIGKTEILRALESHVLKETDYNIGILHLEESKQATVQNLVSYQMQVPLKRRNIEYPPEEIIQQYKQMTRRDNRVFIYSHFGSGNPDNFLAIVRFLVTVCGCKFIFFDHINIVVSGLSVEGDERKTLDYLCTRLAMLVEELQFCLVMICHENDEGLTRGSRNISQTAHVHIRLIRDIQSPNPVERAKTYMIVAKNRPVGPSGPIGYAVYDENKGVLLDGYILERQPERVEDFIPGG